MSIPLKNSSGTIQTLKSTLDGSDDVIHHNIDACALPAGAATESTLATLAAGAASQSTVADILAAVATAALQTSGTQKVIVANATDTAAIETRPFTGVKGLCVNIGPTDPVSDVPVMIDFTHHQVHEGETHKAQHIITATTEYLLAVPTYAQLIRSPHMVISLDVYEGAIKVEIYENPTRGGSFAAGTAVPAFNHNRNSTTTPGLVITHTPTDVTGGTLIETYYVGSGTNSKQTAARSSTEWLLKSNEDYRIVLTEVAPTTATVVTFDWYEDLGV